MPPRLSYYAKDASGSVHLDKMAVFNSEIMAVSFACSTVQAKAVSALLLTNITVKMQAEGIPYVLKDGSITERNMYQLEKSKCKEGYTVKRTRLDKWTAHVVAVCNDERLLLNASQDGLLGRLLSPQYTTPILPAWIGEIETALRGKRRMVDCDNVGDVQAAMLAAKDEELDLIVSDLLKRRTLRIN